MEQRCCQCCICLSVCQRIVKMFQIACTAGGYSWLYFIDFETGKNFTTATDDMLGLRLTNNALTAGIKMVKTESEKTVTIVSDTRGEVEGMGTPSAGGGSGLLNTRRTMWREIQD